MTLGEKLRAERKRAGLTIEELTAAFNKKFGLRANKGMVSKWENDLVEPSSPYIAAYAKLFRLDLNDLLSLPQSNYSAVLMRAKEVLPEKKFEQLENIAQSFITAHMYGHEKLHEDGK